MALHEPITEPAPASTTDGRRTGSPFGGLGAVLLVMSIGSLFGAELSGIMIPEIRPGGDDLAPLKHHLGNLGMGIMFALAFVFFLGAMTSFVVSFVHRRR